MDKEQSLQNAEHKKELVHWLLGFVNRVRYACMSTHVTPLIFFPSAVNSAGKVDFIGYGCIAKP